jgi:hypothetical protein
MCLTRGCPRRWATGPDRDCGHHEDSGGDLLAAAEELGIDLAAPPESRKASAERTRHDQG